MSQYVQQLQQQLNAVDQRLTSANIGPLEQVHKATGQQRVHIALVGAVLGSLIILFTTGIAAVVNAIGFFYPVIQTSSVIKRGSALEKDVSLTYWMIYGSLFLLESLHWSYFEGALYYPVKAAFLVWLYSPATQGAAAVHHSVFYPLANKFFSTTD